jgi:hypothetical protein
MVERIRGTRQETVGFFELSTPTEFPEQFAEGFS